jgi:hypothetical protein
MSERERERERDHVLRDQFGRQRGWGPSRERGGNESERGRG